MILDYELRRDYQKWPHERDRDRDDYDGHPDREPHEIEEWAREHDEYEDSGGRHDHVDVEVLTMHYRGSHGAAAGRSGFSCYRGSSARVGDSSHIGGLAEEFLD